MRKSRLGSGGTCAWFALLELRNPHPDRGSSRRFRLREVPSDSRVPAKRSGSRPAVVSCLQPLSG